MKTLEILFSLILAGAGLMKLVLGHDERFLLPKEAHYSIATLEVLASLYVVVGSTRGKRAIIWGIVLMALAGSIVSWVTKKPCGCLGGLMEFDWRLRPAVVGVLGLLGILILRRPLLVEVSAEGSVLAKE